MINEDLVDSAIRHRLDLLRFEAGTVARMLAAYNTAYAALTLELAEAWQAIEAGQPPRRALLESLTARRGAIEPVTRALLLQLTALLAEALDATARVELLQARRAWQAATPPGLIDWHTPPVADVLTAVESPVGTQGWPTRIAVALQAHQADLSLALGAAVAQGAPIPRATELLSRVPALAGATRAQLVSLARTEIQRVANAAALESYTANADLLSGVEYLATLDSRTCLLCAPSHGKIYPLDQAPALPQHPRCRCFLAPVVKPWSALGLGPTQADLFDGRPSSGPDFPTWLRRQPPVVAEEILGSTRARLWREGLPLPAFSDGRRPLTLPELRERYPDAF